MGAPACILIKLSGVNCGKEFFEENFRLLDSNRSRIRAESLNAVFRDHFDLK